MTTTARRGHPVFAAVYGRMMRSVEAGPLGDLRRDLVSGARGEVVDLGAGVGLNLRHLGAAVTRLHAVEPDPHMARRLRPVLPAHAVLHESVAEALPLPDASVDTVLATLTLCTVDDPLAATGEIARVLRPGGQVIVLEHVRAAEPRLAAWQQRLRRPWGWFSGGCHPARDTGAAFAAAGLDPAPLRRVTIPDGGLVREWLTGVLVRPA